MADPLNINQTPKELDRVHGELDYYDYLRSPEFRRVFFETIAEIINEIGGPVLDVGCGEAILGDYVTTGYAGIDGSQAAITKALSRNPQLDVHVARIESPQTAVQDEFETIMFGGILEVLIKPARRVMFIYDYINFYNANWFIVYDLERLDTSEISDEFTLVREIHATADVPGLMEVKKHRKILVYSC